MSRGGRGGGRGGRGGMRGRPLPFEVDQDLVEGAIGGVSDLSGENKAKQLFPPIEEVTPAPISQESRARLAIQRDMDAKFKKTVWYTGTKEQYEAYDASRGKSRSTIDVFDGMETYSKRKRSKPDDFVPVEKRKFPKMYPEHLPANWLEDLAGAGNKKKSGAKKSVNDRLAKVDESKDDEGGADDDAESVEGAAKGGDDEDAASEPQDSEFSENEDDDADNDYNAENYFSGGEDDASVGGGEEGEDGY